MSTPMNPTAFLMGGEKIASAKFPSVGTSVTGRITEPPVLRQQTRFEDNSPLFWEDGTPRMQLVVTLATEQRDPADPKDDGRRRVYVKGAMQKAVRTAVQASGAPDLQVGGTLTVTFTGYGEPKGNLPAPKAYSATYIPAPAAPVVQAPQGWGAMPQAPQAEDWDDAPF